jgi:hypothetical protein
MITQLDERDQAILAQRAAALLARGADEPQIGDYVTFADGITLRVSYVWPDGGIQTSQGGFFYLGDGYCSFSGGLFPALPQDTLTLTGTRRAGPCWFFHHDYATADNGVDVEPAVFNAWACSIAAPH